MQPGSDVRSRDTDSLTNFFEYGDSSSCVVEKHDELTADAEPTSAESKTEDSDTLASFSATKEDDVKTLTTEELPSLLENIEERKMSEEEVNVRGETMLPEIEQHEVDKYEDNGTTTSCTATKEDDVNTQTTEEATSGLENNEEAQTKMLEDMSIKDDEGKLPKSPETEQQETKKDELISSESNDEPVSSEEIIVTGVPSSDFPDEKAVDAADLPICESATETPLVQSENDQISLTEVAADPNLYRIGDDGETPEISETCSVGETQDSEMAILAEAALMVPDAPEKNADEVQLELVTSNGLDGVVLDAAEECSVDDKAVSTQREKEEEQMEPKKMEEAGKTVENEDAVHSQELGANNESSEIGEPSSTELLREKEVERQQNEEVEETSKSVLCDDDVTHSEQVGVNGTIFSEFPAEKHPVAVEPDESDDTTHPSTAEQPWSQTQDKAESSRVAGAAGGGEDEDDDGKTTSQAPNAQSVLSARDVFIEQQVRNNVNVIVSIYVAHHLPL